MKANFELIEKENIKVLVFPKTDVLHSAEEIKQRFFELNRALILGNIEHEKTKIYFEDNSSKKELSVYEKHQEFLNSDNTGYGG